MRRLVSILAALALTACAPGKQTPPKTRTYTFHALSGISMGAIGTDFLAGSGDNWKRLDAIAAMGGPLDATYFLSRITQLQMGGFCPYATLDEVAQQEAADPTHKDRFDDPNDPVLSQCDHPVPPIAFERQEDYNHWAFTTSGAHFNRDEYIDILYDLSLAMGNPLYYNPDSPFFPVPQMTKANFNEDLCDHPIVLHDFFDAKFNPEGKYPVISYCDGQPPVLYCDDPSQTLVDYCKLPFTGPPTVASGEVQSLADAYCQSIGGTKALTAGQNGNENPDLYYQWEGVFRACYPYTNPVSFALAVDFNGNGRRDYFEPVISEETEPFQDVGTDGCPDAEEDGKGGCTAHNQTGDPNHDNFDPVKNPLGTEGDGIWEPGEPYQDVGLDGVPGTHDYGEGNGKFDVSPMYARWMATDFRRRYLAKGSPLPGQIDVYADGGIRDVFNLGVSAEMMTSAQRGLLPDVSHLFYRFTSIPQVGGAPWPNGVYDGTSADYDAMGQNVFVRYGDPNASPQDIRGGEGDHVGTYGEVISRFTTYVEWLSHHWQRVLGPATTPSSPPRQFSVTIFSEKLHALRSFDVALPPGYDDPANKDTRYPVVFLLHGYGMDSANMSNTFIVIQGLMSARKNPILPMIFVFPSGRCCYVSKADGHKDCRDDDDNGNALSDNPDFVRECRTGTFFVNRAGFAAGDNTAYGDSLFEIMDYVDQHYRTLKPETVTVK